MAVKASASITLSFMVDVYASYRYYKLQASTASAPDAPTAFPPSTSSGWDDTEPSYTSGSTNTLYFVDCTVFTDDSFAYSKVSISSSYEAAKEAWNKANNAQKTADDAKDTADSANDKIDNLEVGGRNLLLNSNFYNGLANWETSQVSMAVTADSVYGHYATASGGGRAMAFSNNTPNIWKDEQIYSYSFYAKSNRSGVTIEPSRSGSDYGTEHSLTTEWVKYTGTITSTATYGRFSLFINSTTAIYYIANLKLEYGNKATDWTPAPEDVDNAIDDAAKTATNYMEFTEGTGLVVGDMTSDTLGNNVLINSNGVNIRTGEMVNASFSANQIELGKGNDNAVVSLVNDRLKMQYTSGDVPYCGIKTSGNLHILAGVDKNLHLGLDGMGDVWGIDLGVDNTKFNARFGFNNINFEADTINFKTGSTSLTKNSNYRIYGGRVLYSNSSGSTGTITLNETANNFSMIEIFYGKDSQGYDSTKIFLPNGKTASLTATNMFSTTGIQTATKLVTISGTSVTPNTSRCGYVNSDGSVLKTGAENAIKIRYVVGYK